jgi:multimeric flavodoxin WrbA
MVGSSRRQGNTSKSVAELSKGHDPEIIHLCDHDIGYFDYRYANQEDDFVRLSQRMLQADKIIFATPVYWYAMSAELKTFFDRLSDLLDLRKAEGRKLKGKDVFLLANGKTDIELPEGFEIPFKRTADYFEMNYKGKCFFKFSESDEIDYTYTDNIELFREKVFT